ncbi:V-type ATP synthase subunit C [Peptoniphilus catoniae]|uniref:V-type ATP synthase subunit C n=1 Tax=Peptoniphilus catoniae TaxID=1660341 RepID=UPI0010FDF807|nr:V-type ATP synthase subunit C [Peptoniphilus catoniae]
MDREKFIQASALIRVKEKKFLPGASLERLVEAKDLSEALKFLNDSIYQEHISKLDKAQDYEKALEAQQKVTFKEVYDLCPDRRVVDLIANNYYYHNVKILVKDRALESDLSHLYIDIGDFDRIGVNKAIDEDQKSDNEFLQGAKLAISEYDESKSPQNIDLVIDNLYFKSLKKLADEMNVDLFKEYVRDLIDFTNISILLRMQNQNRDISFLDKVLIPGGRIRIEDLDKYFYNKLEAESPLFKSLEIGKYLKEGIEDFNKTGSLSMLEEYRDNYFMEKIKKAKSITYGPEVIFAYLYAKEMEVKNLKIILICKLNGIEPSIIRERLRDSYV